MYSWLSLAELINHSVTALAVLVGGAWVYFKFIRGRTFAYRAELSITASPYTTGSDHLLKATVVLRNTGLSKLPLDDEAKVVYLFAVSHKAWASGSNVDWGSHLLVTEIFSDHQWVESQEEVADEVLLPVPSHPEHHGGAWLAYRLQARVWAKARRGNRAKSPGWSTSIIVPAAIAPISETLPRTDVAELALHDEELHEMGRGHSQDRNAGRFSARRPPRVSASLAGPEDAAPEGPERPPAGGEN